MALFHRERTGEGQKLHVPMYESFAAFVVSEHMQGQTFVPPTGPAGYTRMLTSHRKPYETKDGFICVVPYTQKHWANFLALVGRADLLKDPRFSNQTERTKNIDTLYEIVSDSMKRRSTNDWIIALSDADIPAGPMNSPEDLFECPHLKAVEMFPEIEHPTEGRIRHIKVPAAFSTTPGGLYHHSERLGASTNAVLNELGFSRTEITELENLGAITPKK